MIAGPSTGAGCCARRTALLLVCALTAIVAGCVRHLRTEARPAPVDAGSPAVRGARDGLELWWWVVSEKRSQFLAPPPVGPVGPSPGGPGTVPPLQVADLKYDLEDVLLPHLERPVSMTGAERQRWRDAGLRVVAIPSADVDRVHSLLRTVGPVQRQWLGERSEWTDAVTGPSVEHARPVQVLGQTRIVPPGAFRLLLRCWVAPDWDRSENGPGAVLKVELLPEFRPAEPDTRGALLDDAPASLAPDPGRAFTELLARTTLRAGEAYLIVPESPAADWSEPRPEAPLTVQGFGPPTPPTPTLGEAMLSSASFPDAGRKLRVLLVLVPHLPERFRLTAARAGP